MREADGAGNMRRQASTLIIIGLIGNMLLLGKYCFDAYGIQCEPCASAPCPPCRTDYMKYVLWYLAAWNLIWLVVGFRYKKKYS